MRPGILGALSSLCLGPGDEVPGGYMALRRMQNDPAGEGVSQSTKKFAVLSQGWEVHAASRLRRQMWPWRTLCAGCFNDLRGSLLDDLYDVLDALALGVSLTEIKLQAHHRRAKRGESRAGCRLKAKDPG